MNIDNLDRSVSPKEDFYHYACGGWQKSHPIPDDYSVYGTFAILDDESKRQVRDLIQNLGQHPDARIKDTNAQKVNDIYNLGLDIERRNREGVAPLKPYLDNAANVTRESIWDLLAHFFTHSQAFLFNVGVGANMNDSKRHAVYIVEDGLCLGDRDYYLVDNDKNREIMEGYHEYVVRMFLLAGFSEKKAEEAWRDVIEYEKALALKKRTKEDGRNPQLANNWMTHEEFKSRYPHIPLVYIFRKMELSKVDGFIVENPEFMDYIDSYVIDMDMDKVRNILLFNIIDAAGSTLGEDFGEASFKLFGTIMSGIKERKPLWRRVMAVTNSMFGEVIGQLYVEKYFPEANKKYMTELVEYLRKALAQHIESLDWMSGETKSKALDKLSSLRVKIGYPDKWKDYSTLHIDPTLSYHENIYKASEWVIRRNLDKLPKPVDRDEWLMTPQTVNAYYSPINNEICFPAAILQPPFFDINGDDASNFGAIGVVIGHEMTHGFDDQGRQFDKNGNLEEWWSPEDKDKFNALADKLVAQFDAVEVAPGVHANGRFTLGENIADQGGLRIAMTAYRNFEKDKRSPDDSIKDDSIKDDSIKDDSVKDNEDSFTPEQKFYLSYAGVWASNIRPDEILVRTNTDPHSLAMNRVNVTLRNIEPFIEAFGIKDGDSMYRNPEERVIIW